MKFAQGNILFYSTVSRAASEKCSIAIVGVSQMKQ